MKSIPSMLVACLLGLFIAPSAHSGGQYSKQKDVPLLTTAERTYWPMTVAEHEQLDSHLPVRKDRSMHSLPLGRTMRDPFTEMFRYGGWFARHPEWEPVGIVFRPDEQDYFFFNDSDFMKTNIHGSNGPKIPLFYIAQHLSTFSNKFVLVSARVEKRLCDEFKGSGYPPDVVNKLIRELGKQDLTVLPMGPDSYAVIESPDKKQPFPYDRSRAAEYGRDRELWFNENPNYTSRGLIYQPTADSDSGVEPQELQLAGKQIRHVAAALAKFTRKEVFVQGEVEKRKFKGANPQGTREEILAQLNDRFDQADVRLIKLGPDALALIQE